MAVMLPGSPPGYNKADISGTVKAICGYLRTIHDSLDFEARQSGKRLDAMERTLSSLDSRVTAIEAYIEAIRAVGEGSGS